MYNYSIQQYSNDKILYILYFKTITIILYLYFVSSSWFVITNLHGY